MPAPCPELSGDLLPSERASLRGQWWSALSSGCALAAGRGLERRFLPTLVSCSHPGKTEPAPACGCSYSTGVALARFADTLERQRGEALWAAAAWTLRACALFRSDSLGCSVRGPARGHLLSPTKRVRPLTKLLLLVEMAAEAKQAPSESEAVVALVVFARVVLLSLPLFSCNDVAPLWECNALRVRRSTEE